VADAHEFLDAYGTSVADAAATALEREGHSAAVKTLVAQQQSLCLPLENNLFAAAFAAGLFPERPRYSDPGCTIETRSPGSGSPSEVSGPGSPSPSGSEESQANWLKSAVGVLTLGPVQLAYSPGEVFPFTEIRGPIDEAQMPFPTNCYEPLSQNFYCGSPLPMTPWTSTEMTGRYRFLVGLGEDMIGYLFPPGNFVGSEGEVDAQPWAAYEETSGTSHDRFGHGHSDDAESVGPYAGLSVTRSLQTLLAAEGKGLNVEPGLFLDAAGHLSDSPFASEGFTGAVGVEVQKAPGTKPRTLIPGQTASGLATFDGLRDPGTAGTSLPYSVRTAGVILSGGGPLLIDVYAGASVLHG
jgi:hypothetical protein